MQMSQSNIYAQSTAARVPQYSDGDSMPRGDTDTGSSRGITIRIRQTICDTDFVYTEIRIHNRSIHDQPYGVRLFVLNNPWQCNPIEVHSMVNKHISGVCLSLICSLPSTLYHFIWPNSKAHRVIISVVIFK